MFPLKKLPVFFFYISNQKPARGFPRKTEIAHNAHSYWGPLRKKKGSLETKIKQIQKKQIKKKKAIGGNYTVSFIFLPEDSGKDISILIFPEIVRHRSWSILCRIQ